MRRIASARFTSAAAAAALAIVAIVVLAPLTPAQTSDAPPPSSSKLTASPWLSTLPAPPVTRSVDVTDTVHGIRIHDPYRWLEDLESEEVQHWVDAQNARTDTLLSQVPGHDEMYERLGELFEIPAIGQLWLRSGRLFFTRRDPENEQMVLYVRDSPDADPRVLIDPDLLGDEIPVHLDWWHPSLDGRLLAYGTSVGGSELSTLRVLNTDTMEHLADEISGTRAASIGWEPDGLGFYYTRFPLAGEVPDDELFYHRTIYHHTLGDDSSLDPKVFAYEKDMTAWPSLSLSRDGRYLFIYVYMGGGRNDIYVKDLVRGGGFVPVVEGLDARSYGFAIGSDFYMLTTLDAPNGRIVRVDLNDPDATGWAPVVPESEHAIQSFSDAGDKLMVLYMENAQSGLRIFSMNGDYVSDVPLPNLSSVADWTADYTEDDAYFNVTSFLIPPTVFRYTVSTGVVSEVMSVDAPIDVTPYIAKQVWYESIDGTRVSMFLVHRRDLTLDGTNPTLLSGYGGFSVPRTPGFTRNRFLWLERGGVFATPNLRGGSEYGEDWHRDGMLDRKQNTFDDFIAAAEWLASEGYTNSDHLAVWGGSNGGLLVGAFITQRPELAAAAICDVPLLDMVRYHTFYGARIWTSEYGDPDNPDEFDYIYKYSPYHHVDDKASYPAVFFTAGESDMRVHPSHAMKMTAKLQAFASPDRPILLRLERNAGHGLAARMSRMQEQYADYYSFLFMSLGGEPD